MSAGLPIQVRDTGLAVKDEVPKSDVNKEYYTQNMEREVRLELPKINKKDCSIPVVIMLVLKTECSLN